MPFVLRRLTLAECCSWFVRIYFVFHEIINLMIFLGQLS